TEALAVSARARLAAPGGPSLVAHGHVHEARLDAGEDGAYLNPGYWFGERTFARLRADGPALFRWADGRAPPLCLPRWTIPTARTPTTRRAPTPPDPTAPPPGRTAQPASKTSSWPRRPARPPTRTRRTRRPATALRPATTSKRSSSLRPPPPRRGSTTTTS